MVTIHMLVGIPASGKTTYARELSKKLNIPILSSDEVRNQNPNASEDKIWPLIYKYCVDYIKANQDFIYDATNITPNVRTRFKNRLLEETSDFQIGTYFFNMDPQVCYNRAVLRNKDPKERFIPPEVILSYGKKIIAPLEEEGFIFRKVIEYDLHN